MTTRQAVLRSSPRPPVFNQHTELLDSPNRVGPADGLSIDEVLRLFSSLEVWSTGARELSDRRLTGARKVLKWLQARPGEGWQERWLASGADTGVEWIDRVIADDTRAYRTKRNEAMQGLLFLLLCRVVLPSYTFLIAYNSSRLLSYVRRTYRPDLFAKLAKKADALQTKPFQRGAALAIIAKIVLHTGRDVDQLLAEDVLAYRAWRYRYKGIGGNSGSANLAWVLLREVADLGPHASLRDAIRMGQRPTAELVDAYRIHCEPIRDVLIRYLDERRAAMDYNSFRNVVRTLAGNFWADLERHHPGIDSLRLSGEVTEAWKQRISVVTTKNGSTKRRTSYFDILLVVRAFYLDIQEWSEEDPSWLPWRAPSPVRRGEADGIDKAKKRTTAEMHQRVRDRLPHLPVLAEAAERHRADQATLLAVARAVDVGQYFAHKEHHFRRILPKTHNLYADLGKAPLPVLAEDTATGEQVDLEKSEDDAFWAWAVVEVLRHTGVRIEELLEITHLALISYRLPDADELVPMLQIVPSKSNEERLLLISPELASVLATIITRLRHANGNVIHRVGRYDTYEMAIGPALPHLFQRRLGWRWEVMSASTARTLINLVLARSGLRDAAGEALRYTPHDFRRIFATEAVTGGLPVHIVARLLGHADINVSQAYLAVFDEELVRTYRAFLDKRRAVRPDAEYREPTEQEWREFQQHFLARKLELGECGRPYGTPCKHEHACLTEMILKWGWVVSKPSL